MSLDSTQLRILNKTWHNMKYRCLNKENKSYPEYGGRGIKICQEWLDSFEQFCSDMGARPSELHSIDRKDNNVGYNKSNCRWATQSQQILNSRQCLSIKKKDVKSKPKSPIPECPKCTSKQVLTLKDGERWCRRCGHRWPKK